MVRLNPLIRSGSNPFHEVSAGKPEKLRSVRLDTRIRPRWVTKKRPQKGLKALTKLTEKKRELNLKGRDGITKKFSP